MTPKRIQFNGSELVDQETGKELAQTYAYSDGSHNDVGSRLVACWNACEGIGTDALEKGRMSPDAFQAEESRADRAEAQRDELLAVLKFYLCAWNGGEVQWFKDCYGVEDRVRAAIAKVEGGAA